MFKKVKDLGCPGSGRVLETLFVWPGQNDLAFCSEVFNNSVEEDIRMYTSLVLVALAGSAPAPSLLARSPSWLGDYGAAYRLGRREHRPLAVVIGHGPAGWETLSKDG